MYSRLKTIIFSTFLLSVYHVKFITSDETDEIEVRNFKLKNKYSEFTNFERQKTKSNGNIVTWNNLDENATTTTTSNDVEQFTDSTQPITRQHRYFFLVVSTTTEPPIKVFSPMDFNISTTVESFKPYIDFFKRNENASYDIDDLDTTEAIDKATSEVTTSRTTNHHKLRKPHEWHFGENDSIEQFFMHGKPFELASTPWESTSKSGVTEISSSDTTPVRLRTWAPLNRPATKIVSATSVVVNKIKEQKYCSHFKNISKLNMNAMADVWETVYYRLPEKISCFRIRIHKLSNHEKNNYKKRYGTFDDVVDWNKCDLEIMAAASIGRRHFLQRIANTSIFSNIIILKDKELGTLRAEREAPDQWMVYNHLLLMRDCESGGVVIFAKVPFVPTRRDLEEGLRAFQDEYGSGKLTCDEEITNSRHPVESEEELFNI